MLIKGVTMITFSSRIDPDDERYDKFCDQMRSYRRLFAEFVVVMYNDIMTKEEYIKSLTMWLRKHDKYYRLLLIRHDSAIKWFLMESRTSLAFEILGLTYLSQLDVVKVISKKFNGEDKFIKFYTSMAGAMIDDTERSEEFTNSSS